MVSSLLPLGKATDFASADTAMEMLRILCESDNLAAKDLYEHLQRVRQCLDGNSLQPFLTRINGNSPGPVALSREVGRSMRAPEQSCQSPLDALSAGETSPFHLTMETVLLQPTMQEFLSQSSIDVGLLGPAEMHNDFDEFFLCYPDSLGDGQVE